jgi:hypothetical protein
VWRSSPWFGGRQNLFKVLASRFSFDVFIPNPQRLFGLVHSFKPLLLLK